MRKPRRSYRRRPLSHFEPLEGRRMLATDLAQIAGTVMTDLDNGPGADVMAAGQTVELFLDDGDNSFDPVDGGGGDASQGTDTTDANGAYSFDNLIAGNYWVRINPSANFLTRPGENVSSLIMFDATEAMGSTNITIDDFTTSQDITATRGAADVGSISNSGFVDNVNIEGGEQDLLIEITAGVGDVRGRSSFNNGTATVLSVSSDPGVNGRVVVSYDGDDDDGAVLVQGLGADLSQAGVNSAFSLNIATDQVDGTLILRAHNGAGNVSTATIELDNLDGGADNGAADDVDTDGTIDGDAQEQLSVNFTDFVNTLGNGVGDFSSVTALELELDFTGSGENGLDAQIEVLGVVGFTQKTADFTVLPEMSLGDLVFIDRDNDGVFEGGDAGLADVALTLFNDLDNDNEIDGGEATGLTATTNANGEYEFTGLLPGNYLVQIDSGNFAVDGPLEDLVSSTGNDDGMGMAPDPDTPTANNTDKGTPVGATVLSKSVTLVGGEESGDGDADDNRNESIDFGFYGYDLAITKDVDLDNSVPGGTLVYTMVVMNNGPGDATGVEFTDTLPTGVTFVSATTSQVGGAVDGIPGNQAVTSTIGTLANGATPITITITATVDPNAAVGTPLVNNAAVTGVGETGPSTNNTATDQTVITPEIDLQVLKSDDDDNLPLEPGDTVIYTLRAQNNGPSGATNVVVTDTLPNGLTFVPTNSTAPTTNDSRVDGTTVLTYSLGALASMQNGGSEQVITIRATVDAGFAGSLTNTTSITGAENDTNPNNDTAMAQSVVNAPVVDLQITKVDDDNNQPVAAGDTIRYDLQVQNNGPSDATGVVVTDTLPAGLTFVPAGSTAPDGVAAVGGATTLTYNLGNVTSTTNGGAAQTITVLATVDAGLEAAVTNTATVEAVETETTLANNSASAQSVPALGSINGRVFIDTDRDLVFDPEDTGIANVLIELFNASTNQRVATMMTGTDGRYNFTDLPAGTYFVRQGALPAVFENLGEATGTPGAQTPGNDEITAITVTPGTAQEVAPENNFTASLNLNKRTFFWSSGVFG